MKSTDIQIVSSELYLLPTRARCPLKFGHQVVTQVTCARVKLTVRNRTGQVAVGWGETPLNVEWAWPSNLTYEFRYQSMESFCLKLAAAWSEFDSFGHPLEQSWGLKPTAASSFRPRPQSRLACILDFISGDTVRLISAPWVKPAWGIG